jgi:uncharacterized protein
MIGTIQSIILDFHETNLETGVPRRLKIKTIPGKATVCVGVRRSGKSTYLFQIIQRLLGNGVPRENILYLNFFDDRLRSLRQEGPGKITEAYFGIYPEKKNVEKVYCFFDEIQSVSGWEPFVDRLMRTERCEVYITGSSARMLSREVATQMRGRALSWEIFPFSFHEYLDFFGVDGRSPMSTKARLMVQKTFESFWENGGFPEVAGVDSRLRVKIHQEYFRAMLFRDLIERHDVSHPQALTDLAHRLVDSAASLYTVNSLNGYLKSLGYKASKPVISNYLQWFEDAYFLFTVKLFDASVARTKTNPKKIYCIDHALVTSVTPGILLNSGHLLENLVFTALRRVYPDICYYKTRSGLEVDFVAKTPDRSIRLIQVCESLVDPGTRNREVASLSQAMAETGNNTGIIVSRKEEEEIHVENGTIHIVPAWRFLLDMEE